MPQLCVRYEPNPIPWSHHKAHVMLIVRAVDEATLIPVTATVTSYNPALLNDPNNLDFQTNTSQSLVLSQVTSPEGWRGENLYVSPEVQVNAPGYDVFLLMLN